MFGESLVALYYLGNHLPRSVQRPVQGGQRYRVRSRAFLYERGKMVNLNDLIPAGSGWLLDAALDINDRGQILVSAARGTGPGILRLDPVIRR